MTFRKPQGDPPEKVLGFFEIGIQEGLFMQFQVELARHVKSRSGPLPVRIAIVDPTEFLNTGKPVGAIFLFFRVLAQGFVAILGSEKSILRIGCNSRQLVENNCCQDQPGCHEAFEKPAPAPCAAAGSGLFIN